MDAPEKRQRKPRRGAGTLYQRSSVWWVGFYVHGRAHYESSRSTDKDVAQRLLDTRRGQRASGAPVQPRLDLVTYQEAAEALRTHYIVTGARDLAEADGRLAHLTAFFGRDRLPAITAERTEASPAGARARARRTAPSTASLGVLGKLLRLAYEHNRLARVPKLAKLAEAAPRAGFVDHEAFEAVRRHLPVDLQVAVTVAYTFGWRRNEVMTLEQRHLDLAAGTVRLDPGSTKNKDGQLCYLTPELAALLAEQLGRVRALERRLGAVGLPLFPRFGKRFAGRPIRDFRRTWRTACKRAGVPGLLKHDLRRSAVRNMEQAGVPRSVAMKLTGHRTEAVYRRYAMVSPADLKAAAGRLNSYKNGYNRTRPLETHHATR